MGEGESGRNITDFLFVEMCSLKYSHLCILLI